MLRVGLNPYGISYSVGIWTQGPRKNPLPLGLSGYLKLAEDAGLRGIEIPEEMILPLESAETEALRQRIQMNGWHLVVSSYLPTEGQPAKCTEAARRVGATTVRLGMTSILCGARGELGLKKWRELHDRTRWTLGVAAKAAAEMNLTLAIENHQDFNSAELMDLCETSGPNVGVTLDTGNALAFGEDCVSFARIVAPRIRHVHLKDYRAHWSDEGYRLIRCAIGDGAVPFKAVLEALDAGSGGRELTSSLEPGALEARHIKLLTPGWWVGYAPREAASLAEGLAAARVKHLREDEDWRTPWEKGEAPEAIAAFEMEQFHKSVANMRTLGWL